MKLSPVVLLGAAAAALLGVAYASSKPGQVRARYWIGQAVVLAGGVTARPAIVVSIDQADQTKPPIYGVRTADGVTSFVAERDLIPIAV